MPRKRKPYSRSRRPGRRHGTGNNAAKIAALAGLPMVALGVGGFAASHIISIERPDGYCYARSDQHMAAVLLDSTVMHRSSPTQRRDYLTSATLAYDNAPVNARISLITTAATTRGSVLSTDSTFTICKPAATPQEQETIGAPSKPAPYLRTQAEKARKEYISAVEAMLSDAGNEARMAQDSPVLEQLQTVSRYVGFQGAYRSLTVITDGIQNSQIARFCAVQGDMPRFETFAKQSRYLRVRPEPFTGADISLYLVESATLPQPGLDFCTHDEVRAWWPDYFTANGAASVQVSPLRYWAGE